MLVLLAVDKFKGSLTGGQAAAALSAGIHDVSPGTSIRSTPVADGGDGTVDAALSAGFVRVDVEVSGPTDTPVCTCYARRDDTAVVELANVCGLQRLPGGRLEPWTSSTFGLGAVINHAIEAGARTIVVGVGGSAGTDGGAGLLLALGARITDADGHEPPRGAAGLPAVTAVDLGPVAARLSGVELVVAVDVDNPLLGPHGAAAVYAPQKGASTTDVTAMETGLTIWSAAVRSATGTDHSTTPGAGAAGGAGFGLLAAGARLQPGGDLLLDLVGFDEQLRGVDLVVTGEGSLDAQTLAGKAAARVAARAAAARIPVVAVAGRCLLDAAAQRDAGFRRVYPLSELEPDVEASMTNAAALLRRLGTTIATEWPAPAS